MPGRCRALLPRPVAGQRAGSTQQLTAGPARGERSLGGAVGRVKRSLEAQQPPSAPRRLFVTQLRCVQDESVGMWESPSTAAGQTPPSEAPGYVRTTIIMISII